MLEAIGKKAPIGNLTTGVVTEAIIIMAEYFFHRL